MKPTNFTFNALKLITLVTILLMARTGHAQEISGSGGWFDAYLPVAEGQHAELGFSAGTNATNYTGLSLTLKPHDHIYVRMTDALNLDRLEYGNRSFRITSGVRFQDAFIEATHQVNSDAGNTSYVAVGVRVNIMPRITE